MTSTDTQGISDEQIEPRPPLYRVQRERSYDQRAKAIIAFNTCTGDLDDKLEAAWLATIDAPTGDPTVAATPAAKEDASTMQVVAWLNHRACMPPFVDFAASAGTIKSEPLVREADALAAIKAALELGIDLTWKKMIMEIAGDTIDDMDSPLSAQVRELSARADAIRLLGEDAGRDGNAG